MRIANDKKKKSAFNIPSKEGRQGKEVKITMNFGENNDIHIILQSITNLG